jgi:hypothetical protein
MAQEDSARMELESWLRLGVGVREAHEQIKRRLRGGKYTVYPRYRQCRSVRPHFLDFSSRYR